MLIIVGWILVNFVMCPPELKQLPQLQNEAPLNYIQRSLFKVGAIRVANTVCIGLTPLCTTVGTGLLLRDAQH